MTFQIEGIYLHHHPKFVINEESLTVSVKAMAAVIAEYVKQN